MGRDVNILALFSEQCDIIHFYFITSNIFLGFINLPGDMIFNAESSRIVLHVNLAFSIVGL